MTDKTDKLYYDNDLRECEATVLECRKGSSGFEVLLDRTVIFPESGGQLSDVGTIDGAEVPCAFEEGALIWHRCNRAFETGDRVKVTFDADVRRDHTQQHTGEHMLSGLAHTMFGCQNVGFHMAEDYVTVDLDKPLSGGDIAALEREVNAAIQRNEKTECVTVDDSELESMTIRKKAKGLKGEIRVVYAGGVDSCTCCGTHCSYAGEVGVLKIDAHSNYKGGTRIWFNCGMRAVKSMMDDAEKLDAVARRFSTKRADALTAVIKQGDELAEAKRSLKSRTEKLMEFYAAEICGKAECINGTGLITACFDELNMQELGALIEKLTAGKNNIALLFSESGGTLFYRMARSAGAGISMRELCQAVNAITGGKGGGRDDSAQGSAPAPVSAEEIREQMEKYLRKRLLSENKA